MSETVGRRIEAIARLKKLPKEGATEKDLAKFLGISYESLRKWKTGETAPNRTKQMLASKALDVPPEVFMHASASVALVGAATVSSAGKIVASSSDSPVTPGVAQDLSLSIYTVPSLMSWEAVVQTVKSKKDLPEQFVVEVPDSALAPNAPKGTPILLGRKAAPRPGFAVLVQDANGDVWLRRYKQEADGGWLAEAINPAYATLHPERHGLTILAAMLFKDAAL